MWGLRAEPEEKPVRWREPRVEGGVGREAAPRLPAPSPLLQPLWRLSLGVRVVLTVAWGPSGPQGHHPAQRQEQGGCWMEAVPEQ